MSQFYALSLSVYAGDPLFSRSQSVARQAVRREDAVSEGIGSQRPGNQALIAQTRGAYYSLTRQRFKGFKATIEPNWEVILAHTATQENLKVFRAVRFSMVVDATGAVKVTHEVDDTDTLPKVHVSCRSRKAPRGVRPQVADPAAIRGIEWIRVRI